MLSRNFTHSNFSLPVGCSSLYPDGFNDKRKDDDVKGDGNSYDYGERIYDSRLGRFLSLDPYTSKYPMLSPYQFASNSPIQGIDIDGKEIGLSNIGGNVGISIPLRKINKKEIFKALDFRANAVMSVPITQHANILINPSYSANDGVSLKTQTSQDAPSNLNPSTNTPANYAVSTTTTFKNGVKTTIDNSSQLGYDNGNAANNTLAQATQTAFDNSGIDKQKNDNQPVAKDALNYEETKGNLEAKKKFGNVQSAKDFNMKVVENSSKPSESAELQEIYKKTAERKKISEAFKAVQKIITENKSKPQ